MLKVKLVPTGKRHGIQYRIGVVEAKSKVTGKLVDLLGFYRPKTKELSLDKKALKSWQDKGAQVTEGLSKILGTRKTSSAS